VWFPRELTACPICLWDSLLTLAFLTAQIAIVTAVARTTGQHPAALAAWAIVLPFAVWNFVVGFVTYQQHTYPTVVWYADRRERDPVTAQVHGTVHVVFPAPVGTLLGNIMEHTAHHIDVAIPLFDLPEAQRRVEYEFPDGVKVVRWSLRYYLDCCRQCKLFDYSTRTWTGFSGC